MVSKNVLTKYNSYNNSLSTQNQPIAASFGGSEDSSITHSKAKWIIVLLYLKIG